MNENNRQPWQEDCSYRTGDTQPPKNHHGTIAFLLGLVIFLCGISTALGLMNIKLRGQLNRQAETEALAFSVCKDIALEANSSAVCFSIGLCGETVSEFWNVYDNLPLGIYITSVEPAAAAKGIVPGDILQALNGQPVTQVQTLQTLLAAHKPGDVVNATFFREGSTYRTALTVE